MSWAAPVSPHRAMAEARPSQARLYLLLTLMVLFWSVNFIIGKYALDRLPAFFVFGMRTFLAGAFIWPVYFWQRYRAPKRTQWTWREGLWLLLLGICGVPLNQLFFVVGLSRTSVSHAAIGVAMSPILVLALASIIGQERLTARKLLGMMLALAGVAAVEMGRSNGHGVTFTGDFCIFLSSLILSVFTVIGKRVSSRHGGITMFTFAYVGGGLMFLPLTLWEASRFPIAQVSLAAWLSVIYMAIFPAVVSYLLYYYALTYTTASRVSVFQCFQPVLAILLAIVFLDERATAPLVTGGIVVLTGVSITERT